MAIIEAALAAAAARPLLSSAARRSAQLSCAAYSAAGHGGDIEDLPPQRRPLMARFRERRALAVTDITATEWCGKQMQFVLEHGKPERTAAMKAGSDRHAQLEQEVVELQLMRYKYLWDNLIAEKFPAENFFSYFDLDPNYLLSDDVK